MKYLVIFFFMGLFWGANLQEDPKKENYEIIRIDSLNYVYKIYAKKDKSLYKIVSLKNDSIIKRFKRIKKGNCYKLELVSLFSDDKRLPINIGGVEFYGETIELERDSIVDLYTTKNLIGLYYIGVTTP
jgi:hypothetical protein